MSCRQTTCTGEYCCQIITTTAITFPPPRLQKSTGKRQVFNCTSKALVCTKQSPPSAFISSPLLPEQHVVRCSDTQPLHRPPFRLQRRLLERGLLDCVLCHQVRVESNRSLRQRNPLRHVQTNPTVLASACQALGPTVSSLSLC